MKDTTTIRAHVANQKWWWISFVDVHANGGDGESLGVAIVAAIDPEDVLSVAHLRGCNPGGEAVFYEMQRPDLVKPSDAHWLMTGDQARALDARFRQQIADQAVAPPVAADPGDEN